MRSTPGVQLKMTVKYQSMNAYFIIVVDELNQSHGVSNSYSNNYCGIPGLQLLSFFNVASFIYKPTIMNE